MITRSTPTRRTRVALSAVAVGLAAVALVGCGDDDDTDTGAGVDLPLVGDESPDVEDLAGDLPPGVPEECAAFMFVMEPADPDDLDLPAEWPAPPGDSTLCTVSSTLDGTMQAEYAIEAEGEAVLAHYETELGAEWNLAREAGIGQEILTGYQDTVGFQVQPTDGGFRLVVRDDAA